MPLTEDSRCALNALSIWYVHHFHGNHAKIYYVNHGRLYIQIVPTALLAVSSHPNTGSVTKTICISMGMKSLLLNIAIIEPSNKVRNVLKMERNASPTLLTWHTHYAKLVG